MMPKQYGMISFLRRIQITPGMGEWPEGNSKRCYKIAISNWISESKVFLKTFLRSIW